jgi:predicted nucleotidyltransferase
MERHHSNLPPHHQAVADRFVSACEADDRVLAAFLGGSYARDAADEYSDLDLYLITRDEAFDDFRAQREAFVRMIGEPVFIEDFELPHTIFYILANGAEGELGFGPESRFDHIHKGAYEVFLDKKGILPGAVFRGREAEAGEQTEKLRRLIYWFWHDLSHFITAMRRGQLWWAQGQLEVLRGICVSLARLRHNFSDIEAGEEPYFKIEKAMPAEQLSDLQTTFCPMAADEMYKAVLAIVRFYREAAASLASKHGLSYPESLERVMVRRLEKMQDQTEGL